MKLELRFPSLVLTVTSAIVLPCVGRAQESDVAKAFPGAQAAKALAHYPAGSSTITGYSTTTWQPEQTIAARNSSNFVLSADGKTLFAVSPGVGVLAIDLASGVTLHSYPTRFPVFGPLAVLPNKSQIYVGTCAYSKFFETCQAGMVEIIDIATGDHLGIRSMGEDEVTQIVAAPGGAIVYITHFYVE